MTRCVFAQPIDLFRLSLQSRGVGLTASLLYSIDFELVSSGIKLCLTVNEVKSTVPYFSRGDHSLRERSSGL